MTKWALLDAGVATAWLEYRDMTTYETGVLPQFAPPPKNTSNEGGTEFVDVLVLFVPRRSVVCGRLCYDVIRCSLPLQHYAINRARWQHRAMRRGGITCQVVVFVDVEESQWVRAISFTYLTACSSFTNSLSQCCIATVVYMIQMQADVHCM